MGGFRAGVAEVNMTPPVGISICGFAGRRGPAESIHDDLCARALVLESGETRVGIVTADVISFAPDLVARVRDQVAKEAGIPGTHLMLNGSHTHSGPTVMAFRCMGDRDAAYEDVLCRKVAGAVKMASEGLAAAGLSVGRSPVRIGYNRREKRDGRIVLGHNPTGPEAPWVDVLRVDRAGGGPMGLLYATAAHPVNLSTLSISAEFPGYAAEFISRNMPGTVPMFAQACCGDINCSPRDKTFEGSRYLGTLLGSAALMGALQADPLEGTALASACRTIALPLMVPTVAAAGQALEAARAGYAAAEQNVDVTPYQLRQRFGGQVAWAEDYVASARAQEQEPVQPFEIQAMRIGEVAVVAYPGEMFVDYQLTLDTRSPFSRTVTLGYSNGCIGYVPTADAYPEGGYEVDQAFKYYGTLMIAPACEQFIKTATLDLLTEIHG